MFVYVLDVDVYTDAEGEDWVDGLQTVFASQASAYSYFKAWVHDRGYKVDISHKYYKPGDGFIGGDVEVFDDDEVSFLSWGVNRMEVHP